MRAIIINRAGPFSKTAVSVTEAAGEAKIHPSKFVESMLDM